MAQVEAKVAPPRADALPSLRWIDRASSTSMKTLGGGGFWEDASLTKESASSLSHRRMRWISMSSNLSSSFHAFV
jgi:hypothetical protein